MSRELPIITRPLDNTALAVYMECPKKYEYSMVLHRKRTGAENPALIYGTTWHKLLELYYKGATIEQCILGAAHVWKEHGKLDDHRTFDRAVLEFENYRARWGATPDREDGQTVGWPDAPIVEVSVNALWDGALHPYAGKIDRIIELQGQLFVEDHKTTSQMGSYYFQQFELSNQMMGYAFITRHLTGRWIAGVRINAHAVLKRESKFAREIITFSKDRLEDWSRNYNSWVPRIEASYTAGDFPRNFNACAGKYGQCTYATVCAVSPRIRDRVLEQEFIVKPWNPLEAEELADGAG